MSLFNKNILNLKKVIPLNNDQSLPTGEIIQSYEIIDELVGEVISESYFRAALLLWKSVGKLELRKFLQPKLYDQLTLKSQSG